jgi:ABC-type transport system substrate-binding protein
MVLERNPNYGFTGLPKFDRVEWSFTPIRCGLSRFNPDLRISQPVAAADAQKLINDKNVTLYVAKRFDQMRAFGFDMSRPPFNDKRVRESVGYLMEPQQIADTCWYGLAAPLWGGIFYEDRDTQWGPLLARNIWKKPRAERLQLVNQLLDQAGWRDINKDGIRESQGVKGIPDGTSLAITLAYESNWIQAECRALGPGSTKGWRIQDHAEVHDKPTFYTNVAAGKFQMWHMGQGGV